MGNAIPRRKIHGFRDKPAKQVVMESTTIGITPAAPAKWAWNIKQNPSKRPSLTQGTRLSKYSGKKISENKQNQYVVKIILQKLVQDQVHESGK